MYTVSHSENWKKFPIKHKTEFFRICFSDCNILFLFYLHSKYKTTVEQSFRDFLNKMYSEQAVCLENVYFIITCYKKSTFL